jgi:hypothetical protein
VELDRPSIGRTLRERAEQLARSLGASVRPAWYQLPVVEAPYLGAGTGWRQMQLRIPRSQGPFIWCGVHDNLFTRSHIGRMRLRVGDRRYLDEADVRALVSGNQYASGTGRYTVVDWPRPIVIGRGEVVTFDLKILSDTGTATGCLVLAGFHVDDTVADAFRQHGELWAHTFTITTYADSNAGPTLLEPSFTAGETINLEDVVTTDGGNSPAYAFGGGGGGAVDIRIGDVSLTPLGLYSTILAPGVGQDFCSSLRGLELRAGEQLTVRQRVPDMTGVYTFIGWRNRAA